MAYDGEEAIMDAEPALSNAALSSDPESARLFDTALKAGSSLPTLLQDGPSVGTFEPSDQGTDSLHTQEGLAPHSIDPSALIFRRDKEGVQNPGNNSKAGSRLLSSSSTPSASTSSPPRLQAASPTSSSNESETFETPAEIPRVGGWMVPRRRRSAVTPPLVVPEGWNPEMDPEDRPLVDSSLSSSIRDRPWMEAQYGHLADSQAASQEEAAICRSEDTDASPQTSEDSKERISDVGSRVDDDDSAPNALSALEFRSKSLTRARIDIARRIEEVFASDPSGDTTHGVARDDLIKLVLRGRVPLGNTQPVNLEDPIPAALHSTPCRYLRLSTGQSDRFSQVLVWDPETSSYDVVLLPTSLTDSSATIRQSSPTAEKDDQLADREGRKRKRHNEAAVSPQATLPHIPSAETVASLEKERDMLLREKQKLQEELQTAASSVSRSGRRFIEISEQRDLFQSLYEQGSTAAREAMAESSAAQEKAEKAERQLHEGLEAHRRAFGRARDAWKDDETTLRRTIDMLKSQQQRSEEMAPTMRREINEWKAWKIKEEERIAREAQAARAKEEKREQRRRELEIEAEELAALREEAMALDDESQPKHDEAADSGEYKSTEPQMPVPVDVAQKDSIVNADPPALSAGTEEVGSQRTVA
ncbi:unnamed protein product [Parajaminaea phylloscopi]